MKEKDLLVEVTGIFSKNQDSIKHCIDINIFCDCIYSSNLISVGIQFLRVHVYVL